MAAGTTSFLRPDEMLALEALFEVIVPSDPGRGIPGASEARAANYVARLLADEGSTYFELPGWRAMYREGIAALERVAVAGHGRVIAQLPSDVRVGLLSELALAHHQMPSTVDQPRLFELLRQHCIEGCFSDPRWGGNAERVMWRWFGYLQEPER
jgi:gluconate 2-dehydrogenase gamma chain